MSNAFIETSEGLRYEERISVPQRLFVGFIGVGMFVIPMPFLLHSHLGLPVWQLLLVALCIVAPSLMGLLCLAIALGRCLHLRFDAQQRIIWLGSRWPFGPRWRFISYTHITSPNVLKRPSEDGPFYVIQLKVSGSRAMQLGSFSSQDEAEQWKSRIAEELGSSYPHKL